MPAHELVVFQMHPAVHSMEGAEGESLLPLTTYAPSSGMLFSPRTSIWLRTRFWQLNLLPLCKTIKYHADQ